MRRFHWLGAAAAVLALVVAGCGGGDDGGDGATGAATTASANARCDGVKLTYQLGFFPNPQYAGQLYALDAGYYADEGLDITMTPGGPTVSPSLQIAQGTVEVTDLPLSDALNAAASGGRLRLIAQTAQQNPLRYISWKDSGIETPADLVGKTLGTQQAGNLAPEMHGILEDAGLPADALKQKTISFNTDDFIARRVDVFPLRIYAHISMLEAKGYRYPDDFNVLDPNRFGAGIADEGVYVNGDFADKHPEALACLLRAQLRGWEGAAKDPAGAFAAIENHAPRGAFSERDIRTGIAETLRYATVNSRVETVTPHTIDVAYITDSAEKLKRYGVVRGDVDLGSFIDTDPLEQARSAAGGS